MEKLLPNKYKKTPPPSGITNVALQKTVSNGSKLKQYNVGHFAFDEIEPMLMQRIKDTNKVFLFINSKTSQHGIPAGSYVVVYFVDHPQMGTQVLYEEHTNPIFSNALYVKSRAY